MRHRYKLLIPLMIALGLAALWLLGSTGQITAAPAFTLHPSPFTLQTTASTGGPDGYGYVYTDSRTAPALYNWVDIASSGHTVTYSVSMDEEQTDIALPAGGFDFYGENKDTLYVTTNGYVTFEHDPTLVTDCVLSRLEPASMLAPYCADLWVSDAVYYSTTTAYNGHQTFIVQYNAMTTTDNLSVTFQIVLDLETDEITYQYYDLPASVTFSPTIGIAGEVSNRGDYLQYCHGTDACPPQEGLAVRFSRSPRPSFEITIDPDVDFPEIGDTIRYHLQFQNTGEVTASGAVMTNVLPVGLEHDGTLFLGSGDPGTVTYQAAERTIRWDGDLGLNDEVDIWYDAVLDTGDTIYNTAIVNHPLALSEAGGTSSPLAGWETPLELDTPREFNDRGTSWRPIAVDSSGVPHVVYGGGNNLYYAVLSGTTWLVEAIPNTKYATNAALVLDDQERPAVAFLGWESGTFGDYFLGLARHDGAAWQVETIAVLDDGATYDTSLDLQRGSDGTLHLAYNYLNADDGSDYDLYYTTYTNTTWLTPTVVLTYTQCNLRGPNFSLALDHNNTLHVACPYEASEQEIRIYTRTQTTPWLSYTLAITSPTRFFAAPSLRYQDHIPHLAFMEGKGEWHGEIYHGPVLRYATRPTDTWHIETLDNEFEGAGYDAYTSLPTVLDVITSQTASAVAIAYGFHGDYPGYDGDLRLAARSLLTTTWNMATVQFVPGGDDKSRPSLVLDTSGAAHVVYYAADDKSLRYTRVITPQASPPLSVVDASREIGEAAVAIGSDGATHVLQASKGLRYYVSAAGSTTATYQMVVPGVEAAALDMALDAGDAPHAAYVSGSAIDYAAISDTTWITRFVDTPNLNNVFPSTSADLTGTAHIVYMVEEGDDQVLRHASISGTTVTTETLTVTGPSNSQNQYPQVVAQNGKVYVLYADCRALESGSNYPIDLNLLTWDGSTWITETLYHFKGKCNVIMSRQMDYALTGNGDTLVAYLKVQSFDVEPYPLEKAFFIAEDGVGQGLLTTAPPTPRSRGLRRTEDVAGVESDALGKIVMRDIGILLRYFAGSYTGWGAKVVDENGYVSSGVEYTDDVSRYIVDCAGSSTSSTCAEQTTNILQIVKAKKHHVPDKPVLTVNLSQAPHFYCVSEIVPNEDIFQATMSLSANDHADWDVTGIKLKALATGGLAVDEIWEAHLYHEGQKIAQAPCLFDEIDFTFPQVTVNKGETTSFQLYYLLNEQSPPYKVKTFQVQTQGAWVTAEPSSGAQGDKKPTSPVTGPLNWIYAVQNISQQTFFGTIQAAIDSTDTEGGHTLSVCPGEYEENVTVNKALNILAMDTPTTTHVQAANTSQAVFNLTQPNSTLQGFDIHGGSNGVVIGTTANNAQIVDNHIHDNSNVGIVVTAGSTQNRLHNNLIYANGVLAIDLGNDGLTPNDLLDADTGANTLQNYPMILGIAGKTITGSLNSTPNTQFTIQLFRDSACNVDTTVPNGDAEAYLADVTVTTDANGEATFVYEADTIISDYVLGTATDPNGNTSELTPCPNALVFKVENNGDVYADGTYQTPAADFAELWPVSAQAGALAPGDMLALGPDGGAMLAGAPGAGPFIGVYATQPGFVAGGPNAIRITPYASMSLEIPIALVGVVPVHVNTANGPIRPGDLLALSSTPGVATRALPVSLNGTSFYLAGTFFGKALEHYDGAGVGTIRVLVTGR